MRLPVPAPNFEPVQRLIAQEHSRTTLSGCSAVDDDRLPVLLHIDYRRKRQQEPRIELRDAADAASGYAMLDLRRVPSQAACPDG